MSELLNITDCKLTSPIEVQLSFNMQLYCTMKCKCDDIIISKTGIPEILRVAMLTTYKVEYIGAHAREGIQTGYRYTSSKKQTEARED